jgi:NADH-quinone oxidoreductase subunit N
MNVDWPFLIGILAAGTMTIGNALAIQQNNVKRILAYSSIAHAGYMLMSASILSVSAVNAILFYLAIYLFMNLGAFFFAIFISNKLNVNTVEEYKGLGYRSPLMSSIMVILLVSLTGLPPTAGFIGKVYLFAALIESDSFYWLAVVGILNSVISLFYYFSIARSMWLDEPDDKTKINPHPAIGVIIIICSIPTILFGLKWGILHDFIYQNITF